MKKQNSLESTVTTSSKNDYVKNPADQSSEYKDTSNINLDFIFNKLREPDENIIYSREVVQ